VLRASGAVVYRTMIADLQATGIARYLRAAATGRGTEDPPAAQQAERGASRSLAQTPSLAGHPWCMRQREHGVFLFLITENKFCFLLAIWNENGGTIPSNTYGQAERSSAETDRCSFASQQGRHTTPSGQAIERLHIWRCRCAGSGQRRQQRLEECGHLRGNLSLRPGIWVVTTVVAIAKALAIQLHNGPAAGIRCVRLRGVGWAGWREGVSGKVAPALLGLNAGRRALLLCRRDEGLGSCLPPCILSLQPTTPLKLQGRCSNH